MAMQSAVRRFLQTTGAVYYGTVTFDYPGLYATAPSALAPGVSVTVGYDYSCLLKDIRKTNCNGMTISVWSVLACISAMVMIFCVILIPIACIYRSGRFAGKSIKGMFRGAQSNPYKEIEDRAAKASQGMPVPPKTSQFRQGPNYSNQKAGEEEADWED